MCDNIMRSTFDSRDIQIKAEKTIWRAQQKKAKLKFCLRDEKKMKWNANYVSTGFVYKKRRAANHNNRSLLKIFLDEEENFVLDQKTRTVPYTAGLLLNTIGHLLHIIIQNDFYLYRLFSFFLLRSFHNNEFSVVGKVVENTKDYNFPLVLSAFAKNLHREGYAD